jgi:hypothetical protein
VGLRFICREGGDRANEVPSRSGRAPASHALRCANAVKSWHCGAWVCSCAVRGRRQSSPNAPGLDRVGQAPGLPPAISPTAGVRLCRRSGAQLFARAMRSCIRGIAFGRPNGPAQNKKRKIRTGVRIGCVPFVSLCSLRSTVMVAEMQLPNELEALSMAKQTWSDLPIALHAAAKCFGSAYLGCSQVQRGNHDLACLHVCDSSELNSLEKAAREALDSKDWHMINVYCLDPTRFKGMGNAPATTFYYNVYGIAPHAEIVVAPQPNRVYHATLKSTMNAIRAEGLKPSQKSVYRDAAGKLHICRHLDGANNAATYWASELSKSNNKPLSEYVILEIDLDGVSCRTYIDLHGIAGSGLVLDRFDRIPFRKVTAIFEFADEHWSRST